MKKRLLVVLVFILLFSMSGNSVWAALEVKPETINPDKGFDYKVKRLKEKVGLMFKFSAEAKESYLEELLSRRLSELKYVADNKLISHIELTSQRYETTAGQLAEHIEENQLIEKSKVVSALFKEHQVVIDPLKDNFEYDTSGWRFVKNDFNSLQIYSDNLIKLN